VVFGFLAYFVGEQSQTIFYFLISFFFEIVLHAIETVEKFKQPNQATDDFYFKETFFFSLILCKVVIGFRDLGDDEDHLFDLKRHFKILLLDLDEHARQFDLVFDLFHTKKTE
jgi:hypothetical protein